MFFFDLGLGLRPRGLRPRREEDDEEERRFRGRPRCSFASRRLRGDLDGFSRLTFFLAFLGGRGESPSEKTPAIALGLLPTADAVALRTFEARFRVMMPRTRSRKNLYDLSAWPCDKRS